ncbi:MAG: hypothetical protein ACOYLI_00780 [Synechococcus lacustris]|jgi:hypothetical protein
MASKRKPLHWLHHLSTVLVICRGAGKQLKAKAAIGVAQRRRRQRQRLAQQLLEAQPWWPLGGDQLFWRGLRWGGGGFLVAQALHHFLPRG